MASNILVWVDAQPEDVLAVPLLFRMPPLARSFFLRILQTQQPRKTREIGKVFVKLNQNLCICTITMYSEVDVCLQQLQAFFNIMLKRFGVQGVKVQEIVSLDDEILAFLP